LWRLGAGRKLVPTGCGGLSAIHDCKVIKKPLFTPPEILNNVNKANLRMERLVGLQKMGSHINCAANQFSIKKQILELMFLLNKKKVLARYLLSE